MTDPRENCPWKCKHCLCYEGEIKRLSAEVNKFREMAQERARTKHKAIDEIDELRHDIERSMDRNSALLAENGRLKAELEDLERRHTVAVDAWNREIDRNAPASTGQTDD